MRLWHIKLISHLPRQQLLGQHRECCALRGKGWGRNHSVVNYAFKHKPERLVVYHYLIMDEMKRRGYNPDPIWYNENWRGNILQEQENWCDALVVQTFYEAITIDGCNLYPEHNDEYLRECLENLKGKGIEIQL